MFKKLDLNPDPELFCTTYNAFKIRLFNKIFVCAHLKKQVSFLSVLSNKKTPLVLDLGTIVTSTPVFVYYIL